MSAVSLALADDTAAWTKAEKSALQSVWTDAIEADGLKLRTVRLSDTDWARAVQLGSGNAAEGIRHSLRMQADADE